ncbi:mannitol 2-dehydrogenase [Actinocatenispora thailandica]|uniref:Mannitol-1-phosphate 5-dehydrogenase n=1 Tax=Actinocatenispora thailandica TaxID=227318 RepID=A0A7R7HZ07_9ACTN|nr:mannitol dehydrogenase family protein [Actinocatenispora thailandica]BCJ37777.1 mannitol 2-dehydrogenase [Actinocatenispora thailandica]
MTELTSATTDRLDPRVATVAYDRSALQVGIVHFGVGGFHRSHQQVYLDAIAASGETDWGVCGVGLLPPDAAARDAAHAQDGLYVLTTSAPDGTRQAQVIGTLIRYLFGPDDPAAVLDVLAAASTRIVSLTITEGGYGIDDATGEFDPHDELTLLDLAGATIPHSAFGYLTEALRRRRAEGTPPFTVLSCDNMQGNGHTAKKAVVSFARARDPQLADWIDATVSFPSCMVDRITPVPTAEARRALRDEYGVEDRWALRSESFIQWVVEDDFPAGRPDLASVGVQLVPDVEPYELMKLRLLNASHQAMSHLGLLDGRTWVHDVCADPTYVAFLRRYMETEAVPTLRPVPGVDLPAYCDQLIERFAGVAVRDTLARRAVDASDRLPKFLIPVLRRQLADGGPIDCCVLVLAAWSRCLEGGLPANAVTITDRRADELLALVAQERTHPGALLEFAPVFGDLGTNHRLVTSYLAAREQLARHGPRFAMRALSGDRTG